MLLLTCIQIIGGMAMITLSVSIYMAICLVLGLYRVNRIKTFQEYAMGGKGIKTIALLATIYATRVGAANTIGEVERTLHDGLIYILVGTFVLPLPWIFVQKIICQNVSRFAGCMTTVDIFEKQYGTLGKVCNQIVAMVFGTLVIAMQFIALQTMCMVFLNLSSIYAMLLSASILCVYTVGGGVSGVILTDIFQACLFMFVMPLIAFLCIKNANWNLSVLDYIPKESLIFSGYNLFTYIPFIAVSFIVNELIEGPFVQRVLISGNARQLKKTFYIGAALDVTRFVILFIITLAIMNIGTIHNRYDMFNYILYQMNPALSTITILAILAAIMSTADSWINTISIILTKLVYKKPTINNGRTMCFIVCFIAFMIANLFTTLLSILQLGKCLLPFTAVPLIAAFLNVKVDKNDLARMLLCGITMFVACAAIEKHFFHEVTFTFIFVLLTCCLSLAWKRMAFNIKCMNFNIQNLNIKGVFSIPILTYIILLFIFILSFNWDYKTKGYNMPLLVLPMIVFICAYLYTIDHISSIVSNVVSTICFIVMLYTGSSLGYVDMSISFFLSFIFIALLLIIVLIAFFNISIEESAFASIDPLTKMYNRRYIDNMDLSEYLDKGLSVMIIDVDHFKKINDTYGHDVGDQVLIGISEAINNVIFRLPKKKNIVARIGGEEIMIVCAKQTSDEVLDIATNIQKEIDIAKFEHDLKVTVSIGISYDDCFDGNDATFHLMKKQADIRLYEAKANGRNKIVI